MALTRIFSSVYPEAIDSDDQLPNIIDAVTGIDSFHINAMKDSLIAIEQTLGVNVNGDSDNLNDRINTIASSFVRTSGDFMDGHLSLDFNTYGYVAANVPTVFFGDKRSGIIWTEFDGAESGNTIPLVTDKFKISSGESTSVTPLCFIGSSGIDVYSADTEQPSLRYFRDVFGNPSVDIVEPLLHRRIRLFNDLYVDGYCSVGNAVVAKSLVITDDTSYPDVNDNFSHLIEPGSLIVDGNLIVSGHFDSTGCDKLLHWSAVNKPAYGETNTSSLNALLASAHSAASVELINDVKYPRQAAINSAYPIGIGPVVTIEPNTDLKALLIIFSATLVGPGRAMLRINEGSSIGDINDLSGRIEWPRLENLGMYDYNAVRPDGSEKIVVSDFYTVCNQLIIPASDVTRGTIWLNSDGGINPKEQPEHGIDYECSFDNSVTNTLCMYYDFGWIDENGRCWQHVDDSNFRILFPMQHCQMFVYGLTSSDFTFNTHRLNDPYGYYDGYDYSYGGR